MRTSRERLQDVYAIDAFGDGGTIEYNSLTELKVSGSVPFVHLPDIGNDFVRIYSISELGGKVEQLLHGTFIIATPTSTIKDTSQQGSADMYSLLHILADIKIVTPLCILAGTDVVAYAKDMAQSAGLKCIADASSYLLAAAMNYDAGTSYLSIINDLCAVAGFASADIDAAGTVLLHRHIDLASMAPSLVLKDDDRCVFATDVRYEFDIFDVPNVVVAVVSNEEESFSATVANNDPLSPFSTLRRGRKIVEVETFTEIASLADLELKALDVLTEKTSTVESIEIRHSYMPLQTNQCIRLDYSDADLSFTGIVSKISMALAPGMTCSTRLQRYERNFTPTFEGAALI